MGLANTFDDMSFLKMLVIVVAIGFLSLIPGMVVSALQDGQTEGENITVLDKMTALEASPDNSFAAVTAYYVIADNGAEFLCHGPGPYTLIQSGQRYHIEVSTETVDDEDIKYIEEFYAI